MNSQSFLDALKDAWNELDNEQVARISRFRDILLEENTKQNLTRLTEPKDFIEGHLVDVKELLAWGEIGQSVMDLGSGCGVPGLLSAVLDDRKWILAESEGRKAAFLESAAHELGLNERVRVFSGRAEIFLKKQPVDTIVARAVGPVERIYAWIRDCSTWNNLVLFKGPSWEREWGEFEVGRYSGELKIASARDYVVGEEKKQRKIIHLLRVPRGTKK